jgi:HPt (histidine-containing phosphotransfer) domain-containing protein
MTMTMEFDADLVLSAFDGDVDDVKELVALVAAGLSAYVPDLRAGFTAGDTKRMAATAHTIRGALGNVGAVRLSALTRELEDRVRAGAPVTNDAILAIEAAASDLVTALSAWARSLGRPGGPA